MTTLLIFLAGYALGCAITAAAFFASEIVSRPTPTLGEYTWKDGNDD